MKLTGNSITISTCDELIESTTPYVVAGELRGICVEAVRVPLLGQMESHRGLTPANLGAERSATSPKLIQFGVGGIVVLESLYLFMHMHWYPALSTLRPSAPPRWMAPQHRITYNGIY